MLLSVPCQWVQKTRPSPSKEKPYALKSFVGKITREGVRNFATFTSEQHPHTSSFLTTTGDITSILSQKQFDTCEKCTWEARREADKRVIIKPVLLLQVILVKYKNSQGREQVVLICNIFPATSYYFHILSCLKALEPRVMLLQK